MVITPFSVFQTVHKKQGCNSVKNTVAEKGDDHVFGVSDRPRERGLQLRKKTQWLKVVTTVFSAFQSVREKLGYNSVKKHRG